MRESLKQIEKYSSVELMLNSVCKIIDFSNHAKDIETFLNLTLDEILNAKLTDFINKGAIFLIHSSDTNMLKMVVQRNLPSNLLSMCGEVPFGQCLCGLSAMKKEMIFKSCIDADHSYRYDGVKAHGHYICPIIYEESLLGVLNVYVKHAHKEQVLEKDYLKGVCNIIASVISHKYIEYDKKLLQSNNLFLVDIINQTSLVSKTDVYGNIIEANELFEKVSGYKKEELIGKPHSILKSGYHSKKFWKALWDTVKRGHVWSGEIKNRTKNGEYYWVDTKIFPELDGQNNIIGFISIRQDITNRKQSKIKLEEERAKYKILFEKSSSAIYILDDKNNCVDCNEAAIKLFGINNKKQLIAINPLKMVPKHQNDGQVSEDFFKQKIEESLGKNEVMFECRHQSAKGKWIPCQVLYTRFLLNNKSYLLASVNDLTVERQLALSSKMASIGQLAAGVGHEINNPLAIVYGLIQKIEKASQKNELSSEMIKNVILKMYTAVSRIQKIIKSLRELSHTHNEDKKPFEILESIRITFSLVEGIIVKNQIKMCISLPDEEILVIGEKGKFGQVVMNLIVNARDALKNQKNPLIGIKVIKDSNHVFIEISDNGPGIDVAILNNIFDPFFTTKNVNEGTGLGLSLSHQYIKDMNGDINVESQKNHGTTFTIKLPLYLK